MAVMPVHSSLAALPLSVQSAEEGQRVLHCSRSETLLGFFMKLTVVEMRHVIQAANLEACFFKYTVKL